MSFRFAGLAAALLLTAGPALAQTSRLHLGPRLSYQFDLEKAGLGLQLGVPLARQLEFYPSFDYFFVDNGTLWHLNADLKYRIASESIRWLYIGGGLNIAHTSRGTFDDTGMGVNFFAGAESLRGRVHPFGEFRVTAKDGSTAQLAAGLNFTLRR